MSDPARPLKEQEDEKPISALARLRETVVAFQLGTKPRGNSKQERLEIAIAQSTLAVVLAEIDALATEDAALLAHRAQLEELIPTLSDYSYKAALLAQLTPDEGTRNALKKFGAAFGKVVAVLASREGRPDDSKETP